MDIDYSMHKQVIAKSIESTVTTSVEEAEGRSE